MSTEMQRFVDETTEQVRPLEKDYLLSEWEAAVQGTPEALARTQQAQAAYMRFWSDVGRYEAAKRYNEQAGADAELARQIRLIYLTAAQNQQDEATIDRLTALESEVRGRYTNFRGRVDGAELSDNAMDEILAKSADSDQVRDLARVRNEAARRQGFRDHFQRSLTLNEIDEAQLLSLFEKLEVESRKPFQSLLQAIGEERSRLFKIKTEALRPWHYADRFFQKAPPMGAFDFDSLFAEKDPVEVASATYDGLGMEVRPVLARSDLYARPGKNQLAFMTHIDRQGDIRTLNNLERNHRWNETLHHELGHAVYEQYLDPQLPWLLRAPAHILSTEAIALTMGSLTLDGEWLTTILGVPAARAQAAAQAGRERRRAGDLIFTRWCLVMTNFERQMYADPEADLDAIWWDLVERYQGLRRPEGRQAPDWAAKYHVALVPVYYQNYELGTLVSAQLVDRIVGHAGGFVGRKAAGDWLREKFFRPGGRQDWSMHIASATGEPLNPRYFVERLR